MYPLGLINNLDLAKDVVLRDRDQTFLGMHFDGDVEVENLIVDGLVNGIDLKRLIEKRVTLSTDQIVKTNITFHNVTVRGKPLESLKTALSR